MPAPRYSSSGVELLTDEPIWGSIRYHLGWLDAPPGVMTGSFKIIKDSDGQRVVGYLYYNDWYSLCRFSQVIRLISNRPRTIAGPGLMPGQLVYMRLSTTAPAGEWLSVTPVGS